MNKQVIEGGVPSPSVEPNHMSPKTQRKALSGTPFNGEITKPTFNPCFIILGLHIPVLKQDNYCERARCTNHRVHHPDKKHETKLEFIKSWIIKGANDNFVEMSTWKCPRCGKRVRRKLRSWRGQEQ